jgi:hypothetical protein
MQCDRCPIRLDLGPYMQVLHRGERMPSMWVKAGEDQHLCPQCATEEIRKLGFRR